MFTLKYIIRGFYLFAFGGFLTTFSVNCQNNSLTIPVPKNQCLKAVLINGDSIDNFEKDRNSYFINLPYSCSKSPIITCTTIHSGDIVRIIPAGNIAGSESERTARILISSNDKKLTETYKLIFNVLPKLDLFLLIGQSNMAGRGTLTAGTLDTLENVYLLTPHNSMEPALNPLNRYSNIIKNSNRQQLGPGYAFSKKIVVETGINLGLIVNAGGTGSIISWEKGNKDHLYEKTLYRMKAALKWGVLKAVLWHQGENDTKNTVTYMDKLSRLVENLRKDLDAPKAFFIAGELAYWPGGGKESSEFNVMIHTVSTQIPSCGWVSAQDLTSAGNSSDPFFDSKSQLILGERYAEKVLKFCYGK